MSSSVEFLKHGAHYTYEFLLSIECFILHALRRSLLSHFGGIEREAAGVPVPHSQVQH